MPQTFQSQMPRNCRSKVLNKRKLSWKFLRSAFALTEYPKGQISLKSAHGAYLWGLVRTLLPNESLLPKAQDDSSREADIILALVKVRSVDIVCLNEAYRKEGVQALSRARLSRHHFRSSEARLWLSVTAGSLEKRW
jgi:hypothetical protein